MKLMRTGDTIVLKNAIEGAHGLTIEQRSAPALKEVVRLRVGTSGSFEIDVRHLIEILECFK